MELNFVEDKKNKVVVEIKGETHTFIAALVDELWNDDAVKVAAYRIDHPLVGIPRVILETSGTDAKSVLKKAAQKLKKDFDSIGAGAVKALK